MLLPFGTFAAKTVAGSDLARLREAVEGECKTRTLSLTGSAPRRTGFYFVSAHHWELTMACLVGFISARMAVHQVMNEAVENRDHRLFW
ncbi:MAG: hypothetical protein JF616_20975 [Fibrobacteres bacterium]|nr:hypothetical protein [Fibrobacterota bacterium]